MREIIDPEWDRLVNLANRGLDKPAEESFSRLHVIDIFSYCMIAIFVISVAKNL